MHLPEGQLHARGKYILELGTALGSRPEEQAASSSSQDILGLAWDQHDCLYTAVTGKTLMKAA